MNPNPAELYGESLFTVTRAKDKNMLFADAHFYRLFEGIQDYYLGRSLEEKEKKALKNLVSDKLKEIQGEEVRLRISVAGSARETLVPEAFEFADLSVKFKVDELSSSNEAMKVRSFESPFSDSYPGIKMGSYMPLLRLKLKAKRSGFDEAALLDNEGYLLEASTSNLFFYKGERVFTTRKYVLNGIIKQEIEKMFDVEKLDLTPGRVAEFDGAFATNSSWIARPVQSIDQTYFKKTNQRFIDDMIKEILERGYEEARQKRS